MEDPASAVVHEPVDGATESAPSQPATSEGESAAAPKKAPGRRRKQAQEGEQPAANEPKREPRVPVAPELLSGAIEAVLMASDRVMPAGRLAYILGLCQDEGAAGKDTLAQLETAITELNAGYESSGRSFRIEPLSGGYRVMSLPQFAPYLAELHRTRTIGRMTRAAVETLAIIAYKQPMTRAQLEAIRGVNCGEVLRSLTERRLITIKGRAEELGRPLLYGTTKQFLDAFGLASVKDLPTMAEFKFSFADPVAPKTNEPAEATETQPNDTSDTDQPSPESDATENA